MNKASDETGACCLPVANGVTYIRIGPDQRIVGMQKLELVFQQLGATNRLPEETTDEEIVRMARKFNYIPYKAETETAYAEALKHAYTAFFHSKEKENTGG